MKISSKFLLSIVVSTFSIATLMTASAFFLEHRSLQKELETTAEEAIVQQTATSLEDAQTNHLLSGHFF
ncbi:MAG TPA: hypothetical protein GXX62_02245 [Alcaligenaceae bacterium]|nr:hypothetical protein [Alcaligenaceae bacterium]